MKRSLADGSGFLEIDHRESPGLSLADVAHVPGAVAVPAGELLERDYYICSHCQRGIIMHPGRVRDRPSCKKCYHFICDGCEAMRVTTGECIPFKAQLDRAYDVAEKYAGTPDHPDAQIVLTDA